jgi:type IV pilus assembly protein PilA
MVMKRIKPTERGFSLIELLIVVAIILIIAAITIPSVIHSRMLANESSSVASLRTMNTACETYTSTYGTFPPALANLAPAAVPSALAADLLDSNLVSGTKSGYVFTYSAGSADANGNIGSYSIVADPVSRGTTGQRGFYTDSTFVIHANSATTASASDPALN